MVVSRKRKGPKANKKNSGNPITMLSHAPMLDNYKETLGDVGDGRSPSGSNNAKNFEGKRKAPTDLEPMVGTILEAHMAKPNSQMQTEFCTTGLVGHFSNGSGQLKSLTSSVRGKKDFAQKRAPDSSTCNAVTEGNANNIDWASKLSNLQHDINGGFRFSSKGRNELGNHSGGLDHADSDNSNREVSVSPEPLRGLFQQQVSEGVEANISADSDECNAGVSSSKRSNMGEDERPMVELSVRRSKPRRKGKVRVDGGKYTTVQHTSRTLCDDDVG